jgi:hypothetical protein
MATTEAPGTTGQAQRTALWALRDLGIAHRSASSPQSTNYRYFDRRKPEQQARYYARRLAELGFDVTLDPIAAA